MWRAADQGGFDHLWDFDHLAAIGDGGPDRPVYEGWALQAAMAQATNRVRIGCIVTGNTYRHPVLLAKLATTVDHLSNGRLEFGIGAAWAAVEHQMYGIEGLDHRVGRLSEALRIVTSLWTQERTTFEGRYYQLKDAIANPKPVQRPRPPVWIGAGGEQMLKLVARYADVWNLAGSASRSGAGGEVSEQLDRACEALGRDPAEIRRSQQYGWDGESVDQLTERAGAMLAAGFTEQIIYLSGGRASLVAERAAEALPELRKLER